jgi:hypothetical protein
MVPEENERNITYSFRAKEFALISLPLGRLSSLIK